MRIAIKEVGKELQIVETSQIYRTDCVKEFIGAANYPEFVRLNDNATLNLGVHECGLMLNLPVNFYLACNNPFFPVQTMVGTAVFVRTKWVNVLEEEIWDYEVEDLTDEDILIINDLLDKSTQLMLEDQYRQLNQRTPIGFVPISFQVMFQLTSVLSQTIYSNAKAFAEKGDDTFFMPTFFIQNIIESDIAQNNIEEGKEFADYLKTACTKISEISEVSVEYKGHDKEQTHFTIGTVILSN